MPQQEIKYFLCYGGENEDLMDDFVERFKNHFNNPSLLYDKTPFAGNMHKRFEAFAKRCQVAILLVNAKFTTIDSYASKYEMPILLERQKNKGVIIIGVLFQDTDVKGWNENGDVYFFQLRNNDLLRTRINDENADKHNRQFAVYELIAKQDRNTYLRKLKEWISELVDNSLLEIEVKNDIDSTYEEDSEISLDELEILFGKMEISLHIIEKKLRKMANIYFDNNGFKRPSNLKSSFVDSYFKLQSAKIQNIKKELEKINTSHYDFIRPIKDQVLELKKCCLEMQLLLEGTPCEDTALYESLQYSIKRSETIEKRLFSLISNSSESDKTIFKLDYILPLIEELQNLGENMMKFPGKNVNPSDN